MRKAHHHDPQTSLDAGYEVSDMNAGVLVKFAVGLGVTIIASVVIILGVIYTIDRRGPMNTAPVSPLTLEMRQAPAGPLLQTDPIGERRQTIAAAQQHLGSYAIIDENPEATRARIPVDVAIDLVAEGALPYRQAPFTARLDGGVAPAVAEPAAAASAESMPANEAPATPAAVVEQVPAPAPQVQEVAPEVSGQVSPPGAGTREPFEIPDSEGSVDAVSASGAAADTGGQ